MIAWAAVPLAILGVVEAVVRQSVDAIPRWYGAAQRHAERERIDVLFVGSSRVAAAVHVPTFRQAVHALSGRCPQVLNLARGYATITQHALGIRNLVTDHPDRLHGVTVFIEATNGVGRAEDWTSPWFSREQPWLLVDLLRWRDLLPFWMSRGLNVGDKAHVSARFASRGLLTVFNRRERLREQLLTEGLDWLQVLLTRGRIGENPLGGESGEGELSGWEAGIRGDHASMVAARRLAVRVTDGILATQKPVRGWEASILSDVIAWVRARGGDVVFFETPLSSPFARLDHTPIGQDDRRRFSAQARAWSTPVLPPPAPLPDDEFPDLWHLSSAAARLFTSSLAGAWYQVAQARAREVAGEVAVTCKPTAASPRTAPPR
jgi:hypothetical protein